MHHGFVAVCLCGVIACASSNSGEHDSDSKPSTDPRAGSGGFDPSLDTPRELREDAGSDEIAAEGHAPQTKSTEPGAGGGGTANGAASGDPPAAAAKCQSLVLIADDGTFLGEASSKPTVANGVCNPYGIYGSPYGQFSIFNESGSYGSDLAPASAFNELGSKPPRLFCETTGMRLNPITKNELLPGAIDPEVLCATLAQNGY